jgi:hypothetical protein
MERYSVNRVKGQDVNISMPVGSSFTQVGLTESIDRLVDDETNKSINPYQDEEQIAYKTIDTNGFDISFRFYNRASGIYEEDYSVMGFDTITGLTKNSFTKSFFRLYFYDKNESESRNLILYEDLDVTGTIQPTLNLKRVYWFRNSELFNTTSENKKLYIIGRFFNALNGKVYDFYNLPLTYTAPITITEYSQNSGWWTSPTMLINPNTNNGNYNIVTIPFIGANEVNKITLTERVIL